jgi:hypothetical protein
MKRSEVCPRWGDAVPTASLSTSASQVFVLLCVGLCVAVVALRGGQHASHALQVGPDGLEKSELAEVLRRPAGLKYTMLLHALHSHVEHVRSQSLDALAEAEEVAHGKAPVSAIMRQHNLCDDAPDVEVCKKHHAKLAPIPAWKKLLGMQLKSVVRDNE